MLDIRLDYINNIHPDYLEMMKNVRDHFVKLDNELKCFDKIPGFNEQAARCMAIARTHVETACQYTIKALCLMGEMRESDSLIDEGSK